MSKLKRIAENTVNIKELIKIALNTNELKIIQDLKNEDIPNIFSENKNKLLKNIERKMSKINIDNSFNMQEFNNLIINLAINLCEDIWIDEKEKYLKVIKTAFNKLIKNDEYMNIRNDAKILKIFSNFFFENIFKLISNEINETDKSVNNKFITESIENLSGNILKDFLNSNNSNNKSNTSNEPMLERDTVSLYVKELLNSDVVYSSTIAKKFQSIIINKYFENILDDIYKQYTELSTYPTTQTDFNKIEQKPIIKLIENIVNDLKSKRNKLYSEIYAYDKNNTLFSAREFKTLFDDFFYNEINKNIIPDKQSIIQYFNDIKNRMDLNSKNDLNKIKDEVLTLRNQSTNNDNINTSNDNSNTNNTTNDNSNTNNTTNNTTDETLILNQDEINNKLKPEDSTNNIETKEKESSPKLYSLQYMESPKVNKALEELIDKLQDIDGVDFDLIKNDRNQFSKLKKQRKNYAKFNKFAVDDFFAFVRNLGFDQTVVQNNICANYYEGTSVTELNGKVDTIFYYPSTTTSRLKKKKITADGIDLQDVVDSQPKMLPEPTEQKLLPAPTPASSFYAVLSTANAGLVEALDFNNIDYENINALDPNIKSFSDFAEAEKWILDNNSIMQREVINNQFVSDKYWKEYEKKLYENYYKDGAKNDVQQIETFNITIPNNPEAQQIYDEWFAKYKNLFNRYESQNI